MEERTSIGLHATWGTAGEGRAWLQDGTVGSITAATHEAIAVELPRSATQDESLVMSVGDAYRLVGPLKAKVIHTDSRPDGKTFAVFRLERPSPELRRELAELLISWPHSARRPLPTFEGLGARLLDDPRRIEDLLEAFGAEGLPALVRHGPGGLYGEARLQALPRDRTSELPLHWQVEGALPVVPFTLEVGTDAFVYELPVIRARAQRGELWSEIPTSLLRLPVEARWLHAVPREQRWRVEPEGRPARTLTRTAATRVAFPLLPGERAEVGGRSRLTLHALGGSPIPGELRVQGTFPAPGSRETLCVAQFQPTGEDAHRRWEEALEHIRNPHTRRAGIWADRLWELYDKSGYFRLSGKTTAHFSRLRRSFAVATRRLDTAPELGCQVVWSTPERIEAGLSMLLVYSRTAMVYQVARRRDADSPAPARRMLRAINVHAFEHVQRDPGFEWTLVYVQEGGARWSHLAYRVFTEAQLPTGLCCVVRFRAMEWQGGPSPTPSGDFETGPASPQELALLNAMLPRLRPRPYLEALDLVPGRFDLGEVRARWAQAGFGREREVRIARRQGRPVMAAILESSNDALHLFGLLDSVRFFRFSPEGGPAVASLIASARAWFEARGKQSFVCLFDGECFDDAAQPGLYDLGTANLLAFPRLLLPDFLEHLYVITAPRPEGH